jgi:hypothetical protein
LGEKISSCRQLGKIIKSAFIKRLRRSENTKGRCSNYIQTSKNPMIYFGERFWIMLLLNLVSIWKYKKIKMCVKDNYTEVRVGKHFLTNFLLWMFWKKRPFITKACTLCCKICNQKGSDRLGVVEMK